MKCFPDFEVFPNNELYQLTFSLNNSPMNLMLPSDRFRALVSVIFNSSVSSFFFSSYGNDMDTHHTVDPLSKNTFGISVLISEVS